MKLYLYLDDSGKLHKQKDKFVSYSFILMNHGQRKTIDKVFARTWWKIANPVLNKQYTKEIIERMRKDYLFSDRYKRDMYLSSFYKEDPKGQAFIVRYNRTIAGTNIEDNKDSFNDFLGVYKYPKSIGTVSVCKINDKHNYDDKFEQIAVKKEMLRGLIFSLLKNGTISADDVLKIYIDVEFGSLDQVKLANNIKNYLADNLPAFPSLTVEFLDSKFSIYIRAADLLANASYKMLNKKYNNLSNPYYFWNYVFTMRKNNFIFIMKLIS